MRFLRVVAALVALAQITSAQTRRSTISETLMNAIAGHLKACHDIHKFALNVDHVPYDQSPLRIMRKFNNANSLSKSCADDANSLIEPWRQLSGSDKEEDEARWVKKLGFQFDEILGDYNFFNFMVLNTADSLEQLPSSCALCSPVKGSIYFHPRKSTAADRFPGTPDDENATLHRGLGL